MVVPVAHSRSPEAHIDSASDVHIITFSNCVRFTTNDIQSTCRTFKRSHASSALSSQGFRRKGSESALGVFGLAGSAHVTKESRAQCSINATNYAQIKTASRERRHSLCAAARRLQGGGLRRRGKGTTTLCQEELVLTIFNEGEVKERGSICNWRSMRETGLFSKLVAHESDSQRLRI